VCVLRGEWFVFVVYVLCCVLILNTLHECIYIPMLFLLSLFFVVPGARAVCLMLLFCCVCFDLRGLLCLWFIHIYVYALLRAFVCIVCVCCFYVVSVCGFVVYIYHPNDTICSCSARAMCFVRVK